MSATLYATPGRTAQIALFAALTGLCACNSSPPPARPPTQGEAVRAEVDRLTHAYGTCVDAKAHTVPVVGEVAGTLAYRLQDECKPARAALAAKTADFFRIGHPKTSPVQAANVADASIKDLEDDIRSRAVVTIVERQNPTKAK